MSQKSNKTSTNVKQASNSNNLIQLFSESVLLYLFWTVFTGHIPAVWFGPMSILRATDYGEEFYYLVAYISPLFLASDRIRKFILHYPRLSCALPVIGIVAALMGSLFLRTLLLCIATLLAMPIYWFRFWIPQCRDRFIYAHVLSLFAFVSSRFAFSSIVPLWWNNYTTCLGALIGLIAAFFVGNETYDGSLKPVSKLTNIRLGVGMGLLVFLSHWILTAHGVIARWIDVDPFPAGIGFLISMAIGILICHHPFVRSWLWWFIAVFSSILLLSPLIPKNIAIFFAYVVVVFVTSLWYPMVNDLSTNSSPLGSLTTAGLVYLLGNLAVIWSVAYCFVPKGTGGYFMRERAGQVFCLCVTLLGLSIYDPKPQKEKKAGSNIPYKTLLLIILLTITAPAIIKRSLHWHDYSGYETAPTDHVRGMAWAIRFGYDNNGFPNFKDVEKKIKEVRANTVLLVETDTTRPFNTNWDIVEYLEENLHMYSDYGPSTMNETWGCALFSIFPIVRADREVLPSPEGENACLIDATLDVGGTNVDVIGVHFGNTEHVLDRELQADEIASRVLAKSKISRKTVWLGYLTDKPGGPNYSKITKAGLEDVSPELTNRYCIYLFHMGLRPENFQVLTVGDVTDTEISIADFYLS